MKNFETTFMFKHYKRVTKASARKTFDNGQNVLISPCNLNPSMFGFLISNKTDKTRTFDSIVNEVTFYDCSNAETGKYLNYFVVC